MNLRLSSLGGLVVFCASLFAISNRDDISPGQIGLTMMYAQSVSIGYKHLALRVRVHEIVYVFGGPSENVSPQ